MNDRIDWTQVRERLSVSERSLEAAAEATSVRLEAVYRQRALRLAAHPPDQNSVRSGLAVMAFSLSDEQYALDLADVAEVARTTSITPVPGAPPMLSGVINLRGEIRPVLDLKHLLGMPEGQPGGSGQVILVRQHGNTIGLKVDRVHQVRPIDPRDLRAPRDKETGASFRFLRGITPDTLMLLNTEAVIADFAKDNSPL